MGNRTMLGYRSRQRMTSYMLVLRAYPDKWAGDFSEEWRIEAAVDTVAPKPPSNVAAEGVTEALVVTWDNPSLNSDETVCNDLAWVRVYKSVTANIDIADPETYDSKTLVTGESFILQTEALYGSARYYQCVLTATGAVSVTTVSDRGYRGREQKTYYIVLTSLDRTGNESVVSAEVSATPAAQSGEDAIVGANFDAQSLLIAVEDDTPTAVEIEEQRLIGRITGGDAGSLTVAQAITMLLSEALPENVSIMLDPAISADTKWSGITKTGTAGTTGLVYGYCYYLASTGKWEKTNATGVATAIGEVAMCVVAADADAVGTLLTYGMIRADDEFPTFTVGGLVFLSAATAGILSSTAPTGTTDFVVRPIGSAPTADSLFFKGGDAYGTLA